MAKRKKSRKKAAKKPEVCWGCNNPELRIESEGLCFLCENEMNRQDITSKSTYRGDCPTKKLARYNSYIEANKYRFTLGWEHDDGWAIILAGDEAAEVGCAIHLHRHPANRIIVVDMDSRGIRETERRWPGVRTYLGDLKDLLLAMPYRSIEFIHFDFMGHVHGEAEDILRASRGKLRQGAVVMYTFMHGRDQSRPYYKETSQRGEEFLRGVRDQETIDRLSSDKTFRSKMKRAAGSAIRIAKALSPQSEKTDAIVLSSCEYQSSSPMEVLIFAYWNGWDKTIGKMIRKSKKNGSVRISAKMARVITALTQEGGRYPIILREMSDIRELTFKLKDPGFLGHVYPGRGLTDREIAEILNINESTIVAWKAHQTRGTYGGEVQK